MRREQRLRTAGFAEAYRAGKSWASPLLAIRARQTGLPTARYGFAVGKRLGKAVTRNRLKRQLRAIVRELPVSPGWDIIVVARSAAVGRPFGELRAALATLLMRAGLLPRPGRD